MEKITIKGLKLFAYHGVNPEEKENGQNFIIDLDYYVDATKACYLDNIENTVSYAKVVKVVRAAFTGEKYDLIERVAQVVCDAVFDAFDSIAKIEITLKKPEAPINADFDYVAVTLVRDRY